MAAVDTLGGDLWVVKAQVHAGGRGKAGGVKARPLGRGGPRVRCRAAGYTMLVTHQSGPEGLPVNVVYVESGSDIDRELYLSMLVDREVSKVSFIASAAGGMDIEQVAADTPEQIFTVAFRLLRDCSLTRRASSRSDWDSTRMNRGSLLT